MFLKSPVGGAEIPGVMPPLLVVDSQGLGLFFTHGARIETLANKIRSLGGVFADFGSREPGDGAITRGMVKVLIHLKEQ
ncbi:MAG: hypothetical protein A3C36_01545 [Omnitrophica WOR_2 bacterium RIFCSPHIGHO2_02_FULL_52_10]|nr:MAG: hypothetical protein A3C36_01545 [Omnitrophica WOR_2 bacterium RIFCSPHIGHO2_02_FULL_52_10]